MRGLHSAAARVTVGAALIALVAVGAVLAELEPIVIVALTAVACVLVVLVGRAYARDPVPPPDERPVEQESPSGEVAAPAHAEVVDVEPDSKPEPELAVSERSARAILASGPPPVQEPPPRKPESERKPDPEPDLGAQAEPDPEPQPDPEPEPEPSVPAREWNIWELQHLVRERPDDDHHEEWAALIVSLRDFARVDGTLPLEFDELVRESFGVLLTEDAARTEAAAAP